MNCEAVHHLGKYPAPTLDAGTLRIMLRFCDEWLVEYRALVKSIETNEHLIDVHDEWLAEIVIVENTRKTIVAELTSRDLTP